MNKKTSAFISIFLSLGFTILASVTSIRSWVRDVFINSERSILATADGYLTKNSLVTVVKVKTADTLSLEIYTRKPETDQLEFLKRIVLPEKRDAHFTFRGNAVNLVLTDLDGDGNLEIITPSFDENLIPRLHVFSYAPETNTFKKMGADSIHL